MNINDNYFNIIVPNKHSNEGTKKQKLSAQHDINNFDPIGSTQQNRFDYWETGE